MVKDDQAKIIDYSLSILGPVHPILGPIVPPDPLTAACILNKLAKNHNRKLRIDVPSGHEEFMSFLEQCGFVKVNTPPVMIKNSVGCLLEIISCSPLRPRSLGDVERERKPEVYG